MTGILPDAVARFVAENDYGSISATAGLVATGLLIALMVEKELLQATNEDTRTTHSLRWLNAAIFPLLVVFTFIVALRFADLLR